MKVFKRGSIFFSKILARKKFGFTFADRTVGFYMKDTRENILETAYTLFMQSSYNAVTMNDIVKQTGLSKGAFYHYFSSKEQLFEEVINYVFWGDFMKDYDDLKEISLKDFLEQELKMVKRRHHNLLDALRTEDKSLDMNYYTLIFDALRILPEFKKRFAAYKDQRFDAWVKVITNAKKSKEIKLEMPAEDLTKMFLFINQGVGMSFILGTNLRQKYKEIGVLWTHLYNTVKA